MFLLFFTSSSQNEKLRIEIIDVFKEYAPEISNSIKISNQPVFNDTLKNEIAPLMALNASDSSFVSSFVLQVERLFKYIVDNDNEKIFKAMESVREKMENILQKDDLEIIQEKREDILKVFEDTFWDGITYDDFDDQASLPGNNLRAEIKPNKLKQLKNLGIFKEGQKSDYGKEEIRMLVPGLENATDEELDQIISGTFTV